MDYHFESNGNITFKVGDGREDLEEIRERAGGDDIQFLAEMLDRFGWSCNGVFEPIRPEDIGALTNSPMFARDVEHQDDGKTAVHGDVWWFPNYQVENFAATLLERGQVTFRRAH